MLSGLRGVDAAARDALAGFARGEVRTELAAELEQIADSGAGTPARGRYGHLAHDSEQAVRALLDARAAS